MSPWGSGNWDSYYVGKRYCNYTTNPIKFIEVSWIEILNFREIKTYYFLENYKT